MTPNKSMFPIQVRICMVSRTYHTMSHYRTACCRRELLLNLVWLLWAKSIQKAGWCYKGNLKDAGTYKVNRNKYLPVKDNIGKAPKFIGKNQLQMSTFILMTRHSYCEQPLRPKTTSFLPVPHIQYNTYYYWLLMVSTSHVHDRDTANFGQPWLSSLNSLRNCSFYPLIKKFGIKVINF